MENMERTQASTAPEIILSAEQKPETAKLLDIVAEQVSIMGRMEHIVIIDVPTISAGRLAFKESSLLRKW